MRRWILTAVVLCVLSCAACAGATNETVQIGSDTKSAAETETATETESAVCRYCLQAFASAEQGQEVTVSVSGCEPGERLFLAVQYASGWSTSKGLGEAAAGEDGNVSWTWKIGVNVKAGSTPYAVVMREDGTAAVSFSFTVQARTQETETEEEPYVFPYDVYYPEDIYVGQDASVEVSGCPADTVLCLRVKYASSWSSASGLGEGTADWNGRIVWSWRVSQNVNPGGTATAQILDLLGNVLYQFTMRLQSDPI